MILGSLASIVIHFEIPSLNLENNNTTNNTYNNSSDYNNSTNNSSNGNSFSQQSSYSNINYATNSNS